MKGSRRVGRSSAFTEVARQYGLKVRRLSSFHSLYRTRAAFRVEADSGVYLIKPFQRYYARVLRAYRLVGQLEQAGYEHMPHWLLSRTGKPIVQRQGVYYYVTGWIDGEKLGTTEAELEQLGKALGRLHQTSRQMLDGTRGFKYTGNFVRKLLRLNRLFKLRLPLIMKQNNQVGSWFRSRGEQCLALVREASHLLEKEEVKAVLDRESRYPAIIHGDVTRPNVISSAEKLYFIDWDRSRKGSVYSELAKALANVTNFSVPLMEALLRGYEEERPMLPEERQLVCSLFRMPSQVWYAAADIGAEGGRVPSLFTTVVQTWDDRLAAIAWLDSWALDERPEEPLPIAIQHNSANQFFSAGEFLGA